MVAVCMKYADNVLKVFATSVSIVLSSLVSTVMLGEWEFFQFFFLQTSETFFFLDVSNIFQVIPHQNLV